MGCSASGGARSRGVGREQREFFCMHFEHHDAYCHVAGHGPILQVQKATHLCVADNTQQSAMHSTGEPGLRILVILLC